MLQICLDDGIDKTAIVYKARLNFNLLNPYLDFLISKGYIEQIGGTSYYRTTAAGMEALEDFRKALSRTKDDHKYIAKG